MFTGSESTRTGIAASAAMVFPPASVFVLALGLAFDLALALALTTNLAAKPPLEDGNFRGLNGSQSGW